MARYSMSYSVLEGNERRMSRQSTDHSPGTGITRRNVVLIPSSGLDNSRDKLIQWARQLNSHHQPAVGGIANPFELKFKSIKSTNKHCFNNHAKSVDYDSSHRDIDLAICDAMSSPRRYMKSLISGKVRWLTSTDDPTSEEANHEVYEWAREDIMRALETGVEFIVIDEIGPEVLQGLGLDAVLRSCLWKAGELELNTLFIIVVEPSIWNKVNELYGFTSEDLCHRVDSFQDFVNHELVLHGIQEKTKSNGWRNWSYFGRRTKKIAAPIEIEKPYEYSGEGPLYRLVRIPLLLGILGIVFWELMAYIMVRNLVIAFEGLFESYRSARKKLSGATNYVVWRKAAKDLDALESKSRGSIQHVPTIVQLSASLCELTKQLESEGHNQLRMGESTAIDSKHGSLLNTSSEHEVLSCLQACTSTVVEMVNEKLYSMNNLGTSKEVTGFVKSYLRALEQVRITDSPEVLRFRTWTPPAHIHKNQHNITAGYQSKSGIISHRLLDLVKEKRWTPEIGPTMSGVSTISKVGCDSYDKGTSEPSVKNTQSFPPFKIVNFLENSSGQNSKFPHEKLVEELAESKTRRTDPEKERLKSVDSSFLLGKRRFFSELAHSYGETALCLSGGAASAYYHLGVVMCLLERKLLPKHLTGASGGALVGSYIATRTDEELIRVLRPDVLCNVFDPCEPGGLSVMLKSLVVRGTLFNVELWTRKLIDKVCGTLTFQEAFEKTGRSFTITVFNTDCKGQNHTRILNYKTTPDVCIYSAVLASSALPKLLPPIELLRKDTTGNISKFHSMGKFWRDGSFENELPFEALRQLFNVVFPIVSQVEPHISPFFFDNRGSAGKSVAHRDGKGWRGGFILAYVERLLKLDLRKWLRLVCDFNLMPKVHDTDVSKIFLGRTKGSVTLLPPILLRTYTDIMSDPNTPEKMERYLIVGSRMTWPKIGMIKNRLAIENRLQELTTK